MEDGIKDSLRSVIIPLWNAYSFFVTYANIDNWNPAEGGSVRSEHRLDRWILSELQTLLHDLNSEMEAYRLYRTVPAMVRFVEKLTNWYIRRSRRRFWKSEDDADKAAAYATLYQVVVTFTKALAPVLPFITETIYQNLVRRGDEQAQASIHLCEMPQAAEELRDSELEEQMELATRAVVLGRSLRSKHNLKTRQPLRRLFLLPPDERSRRELQEMTALMADELNIKEVVLVEDETEFSDISYRPNFRTLGPRFGKRMKEVGTRIGQLTAEDIELLRAGGTIAVADGEIGLDDIDVQRQEKEGVVVAIDNNLGVGLDVQLDDELIAECTAREFVNRVQTMRKDASLDVADRICIGVEGDAELERAVDQYRAYISAETLALELVVGTLPERIVLDQEWQVNNHAGKIAIARAAN
jgi:isoleucyl-tRNA synthetase